MFPSCSEKSRTLAGNRIYLYNRYEQKIVIYDKNTKNVTGSYEDTENQFQYELPSSDGMENLKFRIFSDGNSKTNNFSLISMTDKQIKTLYRCKQDEGIFPIGFYSGKVLLRDDKYSSGNVSDSKVAEFDLSSAKLREYTYTGVSTGEKYFCSYALVGDTIYFSASKKQNADVYDIYAVKRGHYNDRPKLVKSGTPYGSTLFSYRGALISEKDGYVYGDKISKLKLTYPMYFDSGLRAAIQIYADSGASLTCSVTDLDKNKVTASVQDIVDFRISGSEMECYCVGSIKKVKI